MEETFVIVQNPKSKHYHICNDEKGNMKTFSSEESAKKYAEYNLEKDCVVFKLITPFPCVEIL